MTILVSTVEVILAARKAHSSRHSLLVGISGIDGSGKGYITERIATSLRKRDMTVADINIDGWLNLPAKRFSSEHPAEHFYEYGIRFDEMFDRLILPLQQDRAVSLEADLADAT